LTVNIQRERKEVDQEGWEYHSHRPVCDQIPVFQGEEEFCGHLVWRAETL
jgi:hypothetical protein